MTYVHNEIHSVIKKKDEILLFVTTGWPGGDKSGGKRDCMISLLRVHRKTKG